MWRAYFTFSFVVSFGVSADAYRMHVFCRDTRSKFFKVLHNVMSAYLTYSEANNGTLSLIWTRTPVEGAILVGNPTEPVPEFKFKSAGISKLVVGANDPKVLYQGACSFLKITAGYKCTIRMIGQPTRYSLLIVLLDKNNHVVKLGDEAIDIKTAKLAAAVRRNCDEFDAKMLDPKLFVSKTLCLGGSTVEIA